jgi:hypothetical protein
MNHHYFESILPRHRHIFVTSIYQALFALGPPVLSHLLDFFAKRLSVLISSIWDYAESLNAKPPYDIGLVPSFLEMRFGSGHYLVSLARYMIAASRLVGRLPGRDDAIFGPPLKSDPEDRVTAEPEWYVLSPRAAVLRTVHDCPQILAQLEKQHKGLEAPIPVELITNTGHYLLFHATPSATVVRNFQLDEASMTVFSYLAQPREPRQLEAETAAGSFGRDDFDSFMDTAVRQGVILRVSKHQVVAWQKDWKNVTSRFEKRQGGSGAMGGEGRYWSLPVRRDRAEIGG